MASGKIASGPFPKRGRPAFLNFLRAKYEEYVGALRVDSYPYYMVIEPSDLCQLRCPTCVTGIDNELRRRKVTGQVEHRRNRAMLTTEFFDTLLDEVGEYLFLVTFYNFGEPLLNKHMPDLVRRAKAQDIETDLHSNLSLPLSDRFIEDLLGAGLDSLCASIDGFTQEAYQVHRAGGDVELAKANLTRLVKARDRMGAPTRITFNYLLFRFNEREVPAAEAFCQDLGIELNVRPAFIHDPAWLPTYRQGERPVLVPEALALPDEFSFVQERKKLYWMPFPETLGFTASPACAWHYGYSAVTAGGHVTPCCAVPSDEHDLGSVVPGRTRFADVWNNPSYRAARAAFAGKRLEGPDRVENVCTRCPVPRFVHHLYSLHDFKVLGAFDGAVRTSDPLLAQAFDVLSRVRYGSGLDQLFPGGTFQQPRELFGNDQEKDTAPFVEFYRKHLAGTAGLIAHPADERSAMS